LLAAAAPWLGGSLSSAHDPSVTCWKQERPGLGALELAGLARGLTACLLRRAAVMRAPVRGAAAAARPKRYMPFAEGPRNCVGQSLAKLSLATVVATLLQTFSFRQADEVVLCRTRVSTQPYGCTPGGAIRSAALETVFDAFGRKRLLRSWAHIDNPLQSCMQCPRAPARAA